MAEHMIETRILLRYDTLENWMASEVILKPGEVAVAKVEYRTTIANSDHRPINTPPSIGLKVGDGQSYFYELPWIQAIAGDVYSWAKQSTKPTYYANEILDLDTYIQEHSSGSGGGGDVPVAARIYQLVQGTGNNINKYYLQYRTADSDQWTIDTSHYIDLEQLEKIANWIGEDLDDFFSLYGRIYTTINTEIRKLSVSDSYEAGKVVVAVNQTNGKILPEKRALSLNDLSGPLSASLGGTGLSEIEQNTILVGNNNNGFTTKLIETIFEDNTNLATNHAIKTYIDTRTAGLTGAMHYVGEATVEINTAVNSRVNPQIPGYDFSKAQTGDVITYGYKEYVWTGEWHLLGDESSYAIRGSIVNADISPEANISQSKIDNLIETLAQKVNVVDGKGLSTNDYTREDKEKLENIEYGAQVNAIEHIFVNDIERPIITVNGQSKSITLSIDVFDEEHANKLNGIQEGAQVNAIEHIFVNGQERPIITVNNLNKSVNILFNEYTDAERQKLANIENNAQENIIESITINGNTYIPNDNKEVSITIDTAALNLNVIDGAQIPNGILLEDVTVANKKLQLARIAATGNVSDLKQTNDTYIILNCGSSTDVI